jgi:hypothetical protein
VIVYTVWHHDAGNFNRLVGIFQSLDGAFLVAEKYASEYFSRISGVDEDYRMAKFPAPVDFSDEHHCLHAWSYKKYVEENDQGEVVSVEENEVQ